MFISADDRHTTMNCSLWDEWEQYTPAMKADLMNFAMSSMDALHVCIWLCIIFRQLNKFCQHWFFWTWKIGSSTTTNSPRAPLWSYKLGLENGWIPTNPREANVRLSPNVFHSRVYSFLLICNRVTVLAPASLSKPLMARTSRSRLADQVLERSTQPFSPATGHGHQPP